MLAYLFLALAVAVRFMPHPWTFTPVAAALRDFGPRGPRGFLWGPLGLALAMPTMILLRGLIAITPETPALDALVDGSS